MRHIVIVEDEPTIQLLVCTMLESDGHSVYQAWDGGAALDMLKIYRFDMIVLDIHMPKMDGFEFLSLMQSQPFCPPVIILSAHSDTIPQALESMISGRLLKPFTRRELNNLVNSVLSENTLTLQYTHRETTEMEQPVFSG